MYRIISLFALTLVFSASVIEPVAATPPMPTVTHLEWSTEFSGLGGCVHSVTIEWVRWRGGHKSVSIVAQRAFLNGDPFDPLAITQVTKKRRGRTTFTWPQSNAVNVIEFSLEFTSSTGPWYWPGPTANDTWVFEPELECGDGFAWPLDTSGHERFNA